MEHAMWDALEDIASREHKTVGELCAIIATRKIGSNLTAAVRLFIIVYFRIAARGEMKNPTTRVVSERSKAKNPYSPLMHSALTILE
jgi:predicted DNA-binding ribbon-helix-helix protein